MNHRQMTLMKTSTKKTIFLCFVLFALIYQSGTTYAQDNEKINVKVDYTEVSEAIFNLTVTVDNQQPDYSFKLYDKEPWKGGEVIKESKKTDYSCLFKKIPAGSYFIVVRNEITKKGFADTYTIK